MNSIVEFLCRNGGYARMADLKRARFQTRDIAKLCKEGILHKVKPGIYRLTSQQNEPETKFLDLCNAIPKGVICLTSALAYYGLTDVNPPEVHVAIPRESKVPKIMSPYVKVYYFPHHYYSTGIVTYKHPGGSPKIYCMEKTVCDMFRYRRQLGEDLAIEGLKRYMNRKEANLPLLRYYTEICRTVKIMEPYMKAFSVDRKL